MTALAIVTGCGLGLLVLALFIQRGKIKELRGDVEAINLRTHKLEKERNG